MQTSGVTSGVLFRARMHWHLVYCLDAVTLPASVQFVNKAEHEDLVKAWAVPVAVRAATDVFRMAAKKVDCETASQLASSLSA